MPAPVVVAATTVLAHIPGLVPLGSKPSRELRRDPSLAEPLRARLRPFDDALGYPPHQAFLGRIHPRRLPSRPWVGQRLEGATRFGGAGELMPEVEFIGLMAAVDDFGLLTLEPAVAEAAGAALGRHPLARAMALDRVAASAGDAEAVGAEAGALVLRGVDGSVTGAVRRAHDVDEALAAPVLLENLACKATGTLALLHLLHDHGIDPGSIDYVISCGEEAVGDRYQRGGGNMAKAIVGASGLVRASGADIKDFCAAPIPALVVAASLVAAGAFDRVAVVAGGSLPKLGMKFQGHLRAGLPVLEDVLGGLAVLVGPDDGRSPRVRLDVIGRHRVGDGEANARIMEALAVEPLVRAGLRMLEVDDYATELHNPEITEPQGSGNVPARNYRAIAALAARRREIGPGEIEAFIDARGMPGFAPTQGHLGSGACYLPHALRRLTADEDPAERVLLLAKGSLFLGRMCQASDGMSVLLERNRSAGR